MKSRKDYIYYLCTAKNNKCDVYSAYQLNCKRDESNLIRRVLRKSRRHLLIAKCFDNEVEFLDNSKIMDSNTKHLILFAQTHEDHPSLLFQGECKYGIRAEWFNNKQAGSLAVLFAPNGKRLMIEHPEYKSKFKQWVAFDGVFDFMTGYEILEKYGDSIYQNIFKKVKTGNSNEHVFEIIKRSIKEAVDDINTQKEKDAYLKMTKYKLVTNLMSLSHGKN